MKLGEYVPEKIPLLDFSGSGLVNKPFAAKNWNQLQNLKAWRFVKNYKNALNQKGLEMDLMMFPLKQKVPPLLRLDNCIRYIYQINLHNRYLVKGLEVAGIVIFHRFQLFYPSNLMQYWHSGFVCDYLTNFLAILKITNWNVPVCIWLECPSQIRPEGIILKLSEP